jgi:hypothetical protein
MYKLSIRIVKSMYYPSVFSWLIKFSCLNWLLDVLTFINQQKNWTEAKNIQMQSHILG